jgi:hypothetical protein
MGQLVGQGAGVTYILDKGQLPWHGSALVGIGLHFGVYGCISGHGCIIGLGQHSLGSEILDWGSNGNLGHGAGKAGKGQRPPETLSREHDHPS